MQELLRNARAGWLDFTECGKYVTLLILILLYFWFRREECREKKILLYTTVMTVCCIFPFTAAVLMKYQTGFYDYQWIWNLVPMTLMIAYGAVVLLWEIGGKYGKLQNGGKLQKCVLVTAALAVIVLCGRMGQPLPGLETAGREEADEEEGWTEPEAWQVEAAIEAAAQSTGEICLWAPREVVESVRGQRADIQLIYGRNIWDAALGAYFYEPYGKTEEQLYLWMCNAEEGSMEYISEDGEVWDGVTAVKSAAAAGVNRILLPGYLAPEEIQILSETLDVSVQQPEGYYLLVL